MTNLACFSYRKMALPEGGNLSGRMELFEMLRERDVTPVVSLGAEAAFAADGPIGPDAPLRVHELIGEDETLELGRLALDEVSVLVNRIGRSIDKPKLPRPDLLPPMINENETRSLAFRKHRSYNEVLGKLGIGVETDLIESHGDLERCLSKYDGSSFVIKPDNGSGGEGVRWVHRRDLTGIFDAEPQLYGGQVLQPAYDFTVPMPSTLRAYDLASAEAFEAWTRSSAMKEVRVYGFHSPVASAVFPVGRARKNNDDHWFFIDPDSMPQDVLAATAASMSLAATASSAVSVFGTVDFGYGSIGDEPPQWKAIELNGKAPYLVGYDKHREVAGKLRNLLADQIFETAAKARTVVQ